MVRRLLDRFWSLVDAESVVLFQWVFGAVFISAGLYGIFIADHQPPLTLRDEMGSTYIRLWYWLNVAGPLLSLSGKLMYGPVKRAGKILILTGDSVLSLALLAYITGTVQAEPWGSGSYGAFLGMALCMCAGITVTRDIRRLREHDGTR